MSRLSPFRTFMRLNGRNSHDTTMMLLRKRARQIQTREQFEQILATAKHPTEVRQMLEPLLRPDLPCCAAFAQLLGQYQSEHMKDCPSPKTDATAVAQ